MVEETFTPDPPLTTEEEAIVARLNEEEIELIDKTLLSNATYQWRKVAMVVVKTMKHCKSQIPHIPDLFFGQRLRRLVEIGRLESQGNLASMRFRDSVKTRVCHGAFSVSSCSFVDRSFVGNHSRSTKSHEPTRTKTDGNSLCSLDVRCLMKENEQFLRAKMIMTRVVTEKIPQAARWSVPGEFKSWIDGLNEKDFKTYLDRLSVLTRNLSDEKPPQEAGVFITGKAYPVEKMEIKRRLDLIGGEATAYYALAIWRALEAEKLVRELG